WAALPGVRGNQGERLAALRAGRVGCDDLFGPESMCRPPPHGKRAAFPLFPTVACRGGRSELSVADLATMNLPPVLLSQARLAFLVTFSTTGPGRPDRRGSSSGRRSATAALSPGRCR